MQYRNPSGPLDNFRAFVRHGGTPVTNTLILVNTVLFFASYFSVAAGQFVAQYVIFERDTVIFHPWTLITYPLASVNVMTLIWSAMSFFFVGGSLERSWGSARYAGFFVAVSALFALGISLGGFLLGDRVTLETHYLAGLYPPLAGVAVAWGMLMPEEAISIWFVPIRAKYIALGAAILAWVLTGPILGGFAEISPLAAYIYVKYGRSWGSMGQQTRRDGRVIKIDFDKRGRERRTSLDGSPVRSPFDIAGRIRDMQERRRLEKLLRNSGIKDPDWIDEDHKYRS